MQHRISHIENSELVDQYQPKANPLACFRDKTQEVFGHRATAPDFMFFKITGKNIDAKVKGWFELVKFLNTHLDGHVADTIQAFPIFCHKAGTYVEIKAIED